MFSVHPVIRCHYMMFFGSSSKNLQLDLHRRHRFLMHGIVFKHISIDTEKLATQLTCRLSDNHHKIMSCNITGSI